MLSGLQTLLLLQTHHLRKCNNAATKITQQTKRHGQGRGDGGARARPRARRRLGRRAALWRRRRGAIRAPGAAARWGAVDGRRDGCALGGWRGSCVMAIGCAAVVAAGVISGRRRRGRRRHTATAPQAHSISPRPCASPAALSSLLQRLLIQSYVCMCVCRRQPSPLRCCGPGASTPSCACSPTRTTGERAAGTTRGREEWESRQDDDDVVDGVGGVAVAVPHSRAPHPRNPIHTAKNKAQHDCTPQNTHTHKKQPQAAPLCRAQRGRRFGGARRQAVAIAEPRGPGDRRGARARGQAAAVHRRRLPGGC